MPPFQIVANVLIFVVVFCVQTNPLMGEENGVPDDTTNFGMISENTADTWAKLVLGAVDTEFPNKMSLVYVDAAQLRTPQDNFPAFYGCFDWHSSVHGHWLLARLLRLFPNLDSARQIRKTLATHLTRENLRREAEFFNRDEHRSFERMYGWAWYLRLVMEMHQWDDSDALTWRQNLRPLESVFVNRIQAYLPLLTFPIRTGQHADTGFALGQILDYARTMKHSNLEKLVIDRAKLFYGADVKYPIQYEPSGHDFFSSAWNEADLMRRVLPQIEFEKWLGEFVPDVATQLTDGTIKPVKVSDLTDGKLIHLAGLNLNRAWCLHAVAAALPSDHGLQRRLTESARNHLTAGLAYINSGHYEGDHWLATFGLYALTQVVGRE